MPVVGWIVLAVWLLLRHQDRRDERRHREEMAALGHAVDDRPATRSLWTPWFLLVLQHAAHA